MNLKEVIQFRDGTKTMVENCLKVVERYQAVVAFGAGVGGAALYHLLESNNRLNKLVGWSDNNPLKFGTTYMADDLIVIPPEKIISQWGKNVGIIVSSSAWDVIREQLIGYGIKEEDIYLFNFAFMDLEYTDGEFIRDNLDQFQRAYDRMADEKSRKIFVDILNYRITKNEEYLKDMQEYVDDEKYQYFDRDIFSFDAYERFLDVGAYIGDTFDVYNEVYSKCEGWSHYYGMEADDCIFTELVKKLKSVGAAEKSTVINAAAWNENTTLYFDSVAGSSTMNGEKKDLKNAVTAKKVDDLITGEKITFIKMDIEGAEYNALCGMRDIIKENKPILAICVYHKRDDFYKITDFIEETNPGEYLYYMRQYRYTPTETVCYAIPKMRSTK